MTRHVVPWFSFFEILLIGFTLVFDEPLYFCLTKQGVQTYSHFVRSALYVDSMYIKSKKHPSYKFHTCKFNRFRIYFEKSKLIDLLIVSAVIRSYKFFRNPNEQRSSTQFCSAFDFVYIVEALSENLSQTKIGILWRFKIILELIWCKSRST